MNRIALIALVAILPASAQSWSVKDTFSVGGTGGWDYVTVDSANHRVYVTRGTHTIVVDGSSGKLIADIPGQQRAHGVALVPRAGRGFITDGGSGDVVVFDLKTYAVLGRIAAQKDADGIIYDPGTDRVLVVSGDGGSLMTLKPDVDPAHGAIEPPIELGGSPEFLAADGAGKVYINLEDKDQVAVVDLKARKVISKWPVAPGGEPVGMSIDTHKGVLFIGCRKPQKMIVMSTHDGRILSNLPIGAGVDATKFDDGEAFASCGDGSLVVIREAGDQFNVAQVLKTATGARTMGIDNQSHRLFLPTAEFEPLKAGERRPQMKPGTFKILVVAR